MVTETEGSKLLSKVLGCSILSGSERPKWILNHVDSKALVSNQFRQQQHIHMCNKLSYT